MEEIEKMSLKVKRLTETAKLPVKNQEGDMGYDIFSDEDITLTTNNKDKISTGIAIELPKGYGAFLVGRSGLTSKTLLRINLGVIDNGYRGELHIMNDIIYKGSNETVRIEKGDKIAQLIVLPIFDGDVVEVDDVSETDRGDKGFGSSGV